MDPRRRFLLVRLGFYAVLGAIVALILVARPHDDAVGDLRHVVGRTARGERLVLKLDDDGVLRSWDIVLHGRCSDGAADHVHWFPDDDGAPARFTRRGDVLDAVETATDRANGIALVVRLHARATGERATGTFRYEKRFDGGGVCRGGPVPFSVATG